MLYICQTVLNSYFLCTMKLMDWIFVFFFFYFYKGISRTISYLIFIIRSFTKYVAKLRKQLVAAAEKNLKTSGWGRWYGGLGTNYLSNHRKTSNHLGISKIVGLWRYFRMAARKIRGMANFWHRGRFMSHTWILLENGARFLKKKKITETRV